MRLLPLAMAVVVTAAILLPTAPAMAAATVFDDFNGPEGAPPDSRYWDYDGGAWYFNGQLQRETNSPDNIRLNGQGQLVIQALNTPTGITSGRLVTRGKVSMLYGTMKARIKMPSGQGISPAFWLLGTDIDSVGWPSCGEIDLLEMPNTGTHFYSTLIGPWVERPAGAEPGYSVRADGPIADLSADFHNYWIVRSPNKVVIGIDEVAVGTFTPQSLTSNQQWVFDHPMYALLNIAVGDAWAGPPDATTQWPATMLVDWFRWDPA